jgi:hypothetical protein
LAVSGSLLAACRDLAGDITARAYDSGFALDHDTWNGLGVASDGRVYYVLCSESIDRGAQMFCLDPSTGQLRHVGDLTEACGEKDLKAVPQGKSHVRFVEWQSKLYFATHLAYYNPGGGDKGAKEVMATPPPGYKPYPGGHFLAYDMAKGTFHRLASAPKGEGILTMNMDTQRRKLYGLTWPTGYFLRYDMAKKEMKQFGPIAGRGEAGDGETYSTLCRAIVIDPRDGSAYLTVSAGDILRYRCDRDTLETVASDDLRKDYFGVFDPTKPGHMGYNWRQALWYPAEQMIYGVHGNSGYLFRFDPRAERVEVLDRITSEPSRRSGMKDGFRYGYLGFALGPDQRTLYYLTGGPIPPGEKLPAQSKRKPENLHLITYDIPTRRCVDHGPIFLPDGSRPVCVHSLEVGQDGTVYALSRINRDGRSVPDLIAIPPVPTRSPNWRASTASLPTVLCPSDAKPPVQFAAQELRAYLGRILGATLPKQSAGPVIRLEVTPDTELGDEGFELRADGANFRINGGGPVGVLYGAYEFLKRFGGCRFSDLGPDGEHVPRRSTIEVPAGSLRIKPQLWYRGLQFIFEEDPALARQRLDWMAKNGLNYVMYRLFWKEALPALDDEVAFTPPGGRRDRRLTQAWFDRELLPEIRRRGLKLDMNLHNLLYWLPPHLYWREHPEWYALIDGKRSTKPEQLCICTSNTQAVAALIDNVKGYLRAHPDVKTLGVIPEDGFGMCQCDKCVAGDADPKAAFRRGSTHSKNPDKSARYHRLLRQVALAVKPEFPDVLIGGAAYVDLLQPAPNVELPENTTVWAALYWRDGCRPIARENTSRLNQSFFDVLQQWQRTYRGRLTVYEYYMGMTAQKSLPYPMSEVICADWPELKKLGVQGAVIQCWTSEHSVYALNLLAFARCGWADEVDHRQVLDDYLLGAFGSVANEVRPVFERLLQKVRTLAQGTSDLLPNADNVRVFCDPESFHQAQAALNQARRKAADDRERRQVDKLAAAVRYWSLAAEFFELKAQADRLKKSNPQQSQTLFRRALDEKWPPLAAQLRAMPPGWAGTLLPRTWQRVLAPTKKPN